MKICDSWRMRWLPVVLLGACSFTPGTFTGGGTGDDARMLDSTSTADADETDAPTDSPPTPNMFVRRIDIVDAKITGGPYADFPLLVSLNETWLKSSTNGGDVERNDGFDIYFSADQAGVTRLAFEVETYAPVAGTLLAWVKIPALAADTAIYIHYGDASITTSQAMPTAVWSGGYQLVAHMTTSSDATNNASAISAQTGTATTGRIGSALPFNGTSDRIDYGSDTEVDNVFAGGGMAEAWIRPATSGEGALGRIVSKENMGGWLFSVDNVNATSTIAFQHGGAGNDGAWAAPDSTLSANVWHQVSVVYNKDASGNDPAIYIDGAAVTVSELDGPSAPLDSDAASTLVVGNRPANDRTFDGLLDEVRLSNVAHSAGWIATQFRNQSDPSTFYTVSAPL
jgi:hypothetical protein